MAERPEACADWRDDLAAWLVAQGDPSREAALDAHLASCTVCRAEADGLLAVVAVSLAADPVREEPLSAADVAPPERLGASVAAQISTERRGQSFRRLVAVAAGGAAAAAVLVAAILVLPDDDDEHSLDGDRFAFVVGDASAVVAPDDAGGSIVQLVAQGLDPDVTYALWLTEPGGSYADRVPAGTFRPDGDGDVDIRLKSAMPPDDVGRVWATTGHEVALDSEAG